MGQVGTLRGVVFADLDRNGVRDAGEPGLAGVPVTIRQANSALSRDVTTDANGGYQAPNLPTGDYAITVVLAAGYKQTTAATMSKTVMTGDNTAPAIGAAMMVLLPDVRR